LLTYPSLVNVFMKRFSLEERLKTFSGYMHITIILGALSVVK